MLPRVIHLFLAAWLAVLLVLPAPAGHAGALPAQPLAHCRGDTHAHLRIHWPTRRDDTIARHFGSRMPWRIRRWAYLILPIAHADGVDPYLAAGVMRLESNGDPLIWNLDSDARGLMQVLHGPFQPPENIRAGISMLAGLEREFHREDLVLAAYNAGPGAVLEFGGIPPYHETRDYVVIAGYYRDLYAGEHLSHFRTARFQSAWADLIAYFDRICGRR